MADRKPKKISNDAPVEELAHFGLRIRDARERKGWTIRSAAKKAGVSPATLFRLEKGDFKVQTDIVLKVISCLGIAAAEVFGRSQSDSGARVSRDEAKLLNVLRSGNPAAIVLAIGKFLKDRDQAAEGSASRRE